MVQVVKNQGFHAYIENVVNGCGRIRTSPAIVRMGGIRLWCADLGHLHEVQQGSKDRIVQGGVHVSRQNYRQCLGLDQLPDPVAKQQDGFSPCHFAHVIQVGVDVPEGTTAFFVAQFEPGSGPFAGGIPAEARLVRRFAQPAGFLVQQFVVGCPVIDGAVFAAGIAQFASYAHAPVGRQETVQVGQLFRHGLLQADDSRVFAFNHPDGCRFTQIPVVGAVVHRTEADVVGNDFGGVLLGAAAEASDEQEQQKVIGAEFHDAIFGKGTKKRGCL